MRFWYCNGCLTALTRSFFCKRKERTVVLLRLEVGKDVRVGIALLPQVAGARCKVQTARIERFLKGATLGYHGTAYGGHGR